MKVIVFFFCDFLGGSFSPKKAQDSQGMERFEVWELENHEFAKLKERCGTLEN